MELLVRYDDAGSQTMSTLYYATGTCQARLIDIAGVDVYHSKEAFGDWYNCVIFPRKVILQDKDGNSTKEWTYNQDDPKKWSLGVRPRVTVFEGSTIEYDGMGKHFRYDIPDWTNRSPAYVLSTVHELQLLLGMEG